MNGIIVVNKPLGKTSHNIVSIMRRITGIKKVGHTGTLDPEAEGVLPICIGSATKAADMLTLSDKCYKTQLVWGKTTDTQDASGTVLSECDIMPEKEDIEKVIMSFVGHTEQIPPMYSAIKKDGKKLYELARQGIEIERKKRQITINSIKIDKIDTDRKTVDMTVDCSKGTYIRTLCHDIGAKLGTGAYMNTLQRIRTGRFNISMSHTLEELWALKEQDKLSSVLIPTDVLFEEYERIDLNEKQTKSIVNGVQMTYRGALDGHIYRLYDSKGRFLCISECKDKRLVLKKSFWN